MNFILYFDFFKSGSKLIPEDNFYINNQQKNYTLIQKKLSTLNK